MVNASNVRGVSCSCRSQGSPTYGRSVSREYLGVVFIDRGGMGESSGGVDGDDELTARLDMRLMIRRDEGVDYRRYNALQWDIGRGEREAGCLNLNTALCM